MTNTSPTVPRRRLGQELSRLRKAAGMTGEQVATLMEWSSPSKLYKVEGGRQGIFPKELRELLCHYDVTDPAIIETLMALARGGKQRAWWTRYAEALPDSYMTYVGLETGAAELRVYEPVTIHGLLQTEDYARALLDTAARSPEPAVPLGTIENVVKVRMERQALLTRSSPLRLCVVLDEAAIRRVIGGADVMRKQLQHLIDVARLPSVTLQVLPLGGAMNPAPPTNFTIIEFEQESDQDVVYVELLTGAIYVEGTDARRYSVAFNSLRAAALNPAESIALIEEVAADR